MTLQRPFRGEGRDQVLAQILQLVGRDEVRHAQFACDLLDRRIRNRPEETAKVLKAAREFRHLGLEVLPYVPVAEKNDFAAIVTLNQKLVRLTGQGLASADWGSP